MKRWCAAIAVSAAIGAALPSGTAFAHASLVSSTIVDGSVVAEAPGEVRIGFDEAVLLEASHVTLIPVAGGESVDLPVTNADDGATIVAALPALDVGPYILRFTVLDPADLHRTVGSISFGVGVSAPPSETGGQLSVPWWASAARSVADTAMLFGAGFAVLVVLCSRLLSPLDRSRAARWSQWAAVATVIGWGIVLIGDLSEVGWSSVSLDSVFLRSEPGRRFLIGAQFAIGLWWMRGLIQRTASLASPFRDRLLLGLWAAMLVLASLGGHAGIGGSEWVGVPLRFVHLAALSAWLGLVAATAIAVRETATRAMIWRRVSLVAVIGIAVTGATGLIMSGRVVENVTALLSTRYGRLLVAKSIGIVALGVLGFLAAVRVRNGHVLTLRSLAPELSVGVALVVMASIAAGSAPARGERFLPLPAAAPQVVTAESNDLLVNASLDPAQPGANLVSVRVLDTRRPAPGPIEDVTIAFSDASGQVVATRSGTPIEGLIEWSGVELPAPGEVVASIVIDRPARDAPEVTAPMTITPPPVTRVETVVSSRRWAPLALAAANVWVVLVVVSRLLISRRRVGTARYPDRQHV
jgi:copper transport protein